MAIFTVFSTGDLDTLGTLRFAINQSNASSGPNTIDFSNRLSGVIQISYPLPTITSPVLIDGTTGGSFTGTPVIQIDGSLATPLPPAIAPAAQPTIDGLTIQSSGVEIRSVSITNFTGAGVRISGPGSDIIDGCYIGVTTSGIPSNASGGVGIEVDGSPNNLIGTSPTQTRPNVISANLGDGVQINGPGASGNTIAGNIIGLDPNASTAIGNGGDGVHLVGASGTIIGGSRGTASGNTISGNVGIGVHITSGSTGTIIQGSLIGTDGAGSTAIGNRGNGVEIDGSTGNTVGGVGGNGSVGVLTNVISGNLANGVAIDSTSSGNLLTNNEIGTDLTGELSVPNVLAGVRIDGSGNTVGSPLVGGMNLISGNTGPGVSIQGPAAVGNVVINNVIGLDATRTNAIGNTNGVVVTMASGTQIGITRLGSMGNTISGNTGDGILLTGGSTTIRANLIGTNGAGTLPVGNTGVGVLLSNSANNTIGASISGLTDPSINIISGNGNDGIRLIGGGSTGNLVVGNFIGTDLSGTSAVPNGANGVELSNAANNSIGGAGPAGINLISGNATNGIAINGALSTNEIITDNIIGLNATATQSLGNGGNGVVLQGTIGALIGDNRFTGTSNTISGNAGDGISLTSASTGNVIRANDIGSNGAGLVALPNGGNGVSILDSPHNSIGYMSPLTSGSYRNEIAGNAGAGILIRGVEAVANLVIVNSIGVSILGSSPIPNSGDGIDVQDAPYTSIGQVSVGGNVISGNTRNGISIAGSGSIGTAIISNLIGVDPTGTFAVSNGLAGIFVGDTQTTPGGPVGTTIGSSIPALANVVSGNLVGIKVDGGVSTLIQGNAIGTDLSKTGSIGNATNGIEIGRGTNTTIGGSVIGGQGNYISGNVGNGIAVTNNNSTGTLISNNRIGVTPTSRVLSNGGAGVFVAASGVTIGGITGASNVISGNSIGIDVVGASASEILIAGNVIGLNLTEDRVLPNILGGILLEAGSFQTGGQSAAGPSFVTIGGTIPLAANVISGNRGYGIALTESGPSSNLILGNVIGTISTGQLAGNAGDGILFLTPLGTTPGPGSGPTGNTIGGSLAAGSNTISDNGGVGIRLAVGADANLITGNVITDFNASITSPIQDGIVVNSAGNTIGGGSSAANVISGNTGNGIHLAGQSATGNVIAGNFIGVTQGGGATEANNLSGVLIDGGAFANTIGGGNVISGNLGSGVTIDGSDDSGQATGSVGRNVVFGNIIGTNASGAKVIGNGSCGIKITNSSMNTIGGATLATGNVISGNIGYGIYVFGTGSSGTVLEGNTIGVAGPTSIAVPNASGGVVVLYASDVTIGGVGGAGNVIASNGGIGISYGGLVIGQTPTTTGVAVIGNVVTGNGGGAFLAGLAGAIVRSNVISGNRISGISLLFGANNSVSGNTIGTDASGSVAQGNMGVGLSLFDEQNDLIGGTSPGDGNLISGTVGPGMTIDGSIRLSIFGNVIGTNRGQDKDLPNQGDGIYISQNSQALAIGGTAPGQANVISGNAGHGIRLFGSKGGIIIAGNFIGTDQTGATNLGNLGDGIHDEGASVAIVGNLISANGQSGITLAGGSQSVVQGNVIGGNGGARGNAGIGVSLDGSSGNAIGGPLAVQRNTISSNGNVGIYLANGSTGNLVSGNYVGLDTRGRPGRGNADGIVVRDSPGNTIGGLVAGAGNAIGSNSEFGIVVQGASSTGTFVLGNIVGLDSAGNLFASNQSSGIYVDAAPGVAIEGNVASGNLGAGILIAAPGAIIDRNLIGLDGSGTKPRGNLGDGILLLSTNATVGGVILAFRNVISANGSAGVEVAGSQASGNLIAANSIGTSAFDHAGFGNNEGILINNATGTTIGGVGDARNDIGSNNISGIRVSGPGATSTSIVGNLIGLLPDGRSPSPNGSDGVFVENAPGVAILHNVISNNASVGVQVFGPASSGATIAGNLIGSDATGKVPLGNGQVGVFINMASEVTIGGSDASTRNVISGNNSVGVQIAGPASSGNLVTGNFIGLDITGLSALPNKLRGLLIQAPGNTIGGTTIGLRNVISGNGQAGIQVFGADASNNAIEGNFIGTDVNGLKVVGNGTLGVVFDGAASNTLGGTQLGAGNVITGSASADVEVANAGGTGNLIAGNFIGTDATGLVGLSGGAIGVFINNAPNNTIGGTVPNARNIIGSHPVAGIQLFDQLSTGNSIFGNLIGQPPGGSVTLSVPLGVFLNKSPGNTIGGTLPGQPNAIGATSDPIKTIGVLTPPNVTTGNTVYITPVKTAIPVPASLPRGPSLRRRK